MFTNINKHNHDYKNLTIMKVSYYNSDFELVEATRIQKYEKITSAIDKARFIRTNKRGTYELCNGGYLAILKTYTIVDKETGYCLNPNYTLTYNECISLIQMCC